MGRLLLVTLLLSEGLSALDEVSCVHKLEALKELKTQRVSGIEKTAAFFLSGNLTAFSQSEEEKVRKEKIRVLEVELRSCK